MGWHLRFLDAIESMECGGVGAPITALATAMVTGLAQYFLTEGNAGWVPLYSACIGAGVVIVLRFFACPVLEKLFFNYGWWRAGRDDR